MLARMVAIKRRVCLHLLTSSKDGSLDTGGSAWWEFWIIACDKCNTLMCAR